MKYYKYIILIYTVMKWNENIVMSNVRNEMCV